LAEPRLQAVKKIRWVTNSGKHILLKGENMEVSKLLDMFEEEIDPNTRTLSMLDTYHVGLALKVMEDMLWSSDDPEISALSHRCNKLQHILLNDK
jgi:hypothetical protein